MRRRLNGSPGPGRLSKTATETGVVESILGHRLVRRYPRLKQAVWRAEAGFLGGLWALCRALPPDRASDLGGRLGRLIGPRLHKHRHVLRNLRFVLPEAEDEELRRIALGMWENIGRVIAEFAFLERFAEGELYRRIELVDRGGLEAGRRAGKGIFVGAHLANWYLSLYAFHRAGIDGSVVYSSQRNPYIEAHFEERRTKLPCRFLEVDEAGPHIMRELRAGRSIGLLADQRYHKGEPVPFFGVPAETATIPARLALRFEVPFVPVRIERLGGLRFRITVMPPLAPPRGGDDRTRARALTQQMNACFEQWIRERPEQWLCVKRRFPRDARPARTVPAEVAAL